MSMNALSNYSTVEHLIFSDQDNWAGKLFVNMRIMAGILFHYFDFTFPRDTETIVLNNRKPS